MRATLLLSLAVLDHVSAVARTTRLPFATKTAAMMRTTAPWAPLDVADELHDGRLRRLSDFIRAYAVTHGMGMVVNDEDVQCILTMRTLLRKGRQNGETFLSGSPVMTLVSLATKTTPHCKVLLLTKGRMFLNVDFARNVLGILLNQDLKKDDEDSATK